MIATLSPDIIRDIARWLPQNELLHFACTCKYIYNITHDQIYLSITIDYTKQVYVDDGLTELTWSHNQKTGLAFEPVVIRTLFSLTRFLKTLMAHPEYARFINVLVARDQFPDIPVFELSKLLPHIFPNLVNLKVLDWYLITCPLQADLLNLLPFPQHLQSLCGNFHNIDKISKILFPSMRYIDFSNFGTCESLQNVDFAKFPIVKSLTLSRTASCSGVNFSSKLGECCRSVIEQKTENLSSFLRLAKSPMYILNFLGKLPQTPLRLRSLLLRDICVTTEDARILLANIDGAFLNHLSIENCFESLFSNIFENDPLLLNQVHITRRTPPSFTFLDVLSSGLPSLQLLSIGLSNEMCFNCATFKFISKLNSLSKLSVHLKHFCTREPVNLAPLADSLQSHKDTLKYLNICSDVVAQIPTPLCPKKRNYYELNSIASLADLHQLRVLRLSVNYSQIKELPEVLSQMKNIQVVQLLVAELISTTPSFSCNGCVNSFNYAICNTSSLIAQDYFSCPSPFAMTMEEEKNQHYLEFATSFKENFPKLAYIRFDLKSLTLVYQCSAGIIELKDQIYSDRFDNLVNMYLDKDDLP